MKFAFLTVIVALMALSTGCAVMQSAYNVGEAVVMLPVDIYDGVSGKTAERERVAQEIWIAEVRAKAEAQRIEKVRIQRATADAYAEREQREAALRETERAERKAKEDAKRKARAARAAKAAEAKRLHDLDPAVIAAKANEEASREMILAVHKAGVKHCEGLPPQYMNVCFKTNNRGVNDALGNMNISGPDPGKTRRVIEACSTDPGTSADRERRPQVAPAILLGCIGITYSMGGF